MELLPPGYRVPRVQGGGERDPAWVIFFVDDDIFDVILNSAIARFSRFIEIARDFSLAVHNNGRAGVFGEINAEHIVAVSDVCSAVQVSFGF